MSITVVLYDTGHNGESLPHARLFNMFEGKNLDKAKDAYMVEIWPDLKGASCLSFEWDKLRPDKPYWLNEEDYRSRPRFSEWIEENLIGQELMFDQYY